MIKKIAILGSTGSIGKNLLEILSKDKKKYKITLLTANKNYLTLLDQAKQFNVKNIIISNEESYKLLKKKTKQTTIKVFKNFNSLDKIFKKKNDYTMSAITGIEGLKPTLDIIKFTKKIAIANKESIICGWSLLDKEIKKNKTIFIPVDSEHFSLWFGLQNLNTKHIENIILTASGGPLYKVDIKRFKNIKISEAINHPSWKMGRKISIDSATMINKIYEVIEAKNIFDIPYSKISILIHPKSYIHAILKFNNGLIKIIAHETTMKIPIFNTLFFNTDQKFLSKKLDLKVLNNLDFKKVDPKKYQMIKLLDYLPSKHSLYETVIVSANDVLVELFLDKKIKFLSIQEILFKIINLKEFLKYKKIFPKNIKDILNLNNYVRLKVLKKVYKRIDDKKLS
jgi:1-deoxy-D-xylulose-5-phosphate reductoisomerase